MVQALICYWIIWGGVQILGDYFIDGYVPTTRAVQYVVLGPLYNLSRFLGALAVELWGLTLFRRGDK